MPDHKGRKVFKGIRDHRAYKGRRAYKASKGHKDCRA
jgi:hypothetical protein